MRVKLSSLIVIISLLAAMLPAAALAAAPAQTKVTVRNTTGAVVSLKLVDAAGNPIYMDLEAGVSTFMLDSGQYQYYISTICGAEAGTWNVDTSKTLYIECKQGDAPVVQYGKCRWVIEGFVGKNGGNARANGFLPNKEFAWADAEQVYQKLVGFGYPFSFDFFLKTYPYAFSCRYGVMPEDLHTLRFIPI